MALLNGGSSQKTSVSVSARPGPLTVNPKPFLISNVSGVTDVVIGASEICALQPALVQLGLRCDQRGAMDHLPYFLSLASALKKTPHLVLLGATRGQALESPSSVQGALLIFEYRLVGLGTRIFATDDTTGRRTLLAPAVSRPHAARLAVDALMRRAAEAVLLTVAEDRHQESRAYLTSEDAQLFPEGPATTWQATTRRREIPSYLPLESTFDKTLARIGQRTRSNLRYYRRRAETQLGAHFVENASVDRAAFLAFNRECAFSVAAELANWRYDAVRATPGMFVSGVRGGDGRWLSLICGRRVHDAVEIDWQMNRADLPSASLGTVMRAYLLEHEAARGSRRMYFEGGTPHAMRHSFALEAARDLLVLRRSAMGPLLQRLAGRFVPKTNFMLDVLAEPALAWEPWG